VSAIESYAVILAVYFLVDVIAIVGLNLQYGYAGVGNFAFIVYVAVGGYCYGIFTLGSPLSSGGFQHFVGGYSFPFPLPFIFSIVAGCGVGAVTGLVLLRRLRPDYQYVAFFALAFVASGIVVAINWLLNGSAGLSTIPAPLSAALGLPSTGNAYGGFFVGLCLVFAVVSVVVMQKVMNSPWGRLLRAGRDHELACLALGKRPGLSRYAAFIVGSGFAALSGALLVAFTSAWSPASWTAPETIVFFTALIVGGSGNNWGAIAGVLIVQIAIQQAPLFLPSFASPTIIAAAQWILIGALVMAFIWFRPQGLVPQRVRRYTERTDPDGVDPDQATDSESEHVASEPTNKRSSGQGRPRATRLVGGDRSGPNSGSEAGVLLPNNEEPTTIIEARGVTKTFGGVRAVDDVYLQIEVGKITGLMGPNGAGKSTLAAMLSGEEKPTSGKVFLAGADVTGRSTAWLARNGVIRTFQLSSEFRSLSVIENLLVGQANHPGEQLRRALVRRGWSQAEEETLGRAWELLREFDLTRLANERAGRLSGGQRRLVELMRALMASPEVLILDEPFAGIARVIREVIVEKLVGLRESGMTVLLVEHELEILHRIADTVVVMARGCKIAEGPMTEVVALSEVRSAYIAG
jgi:branched-chain amino acid transport system permease protein